MNAYSIFLLLGFLTIAATLASLRRDHIRPEFSVSWLIAGALMVLLALFPAVLRGLAGRIGLDPSLCFAIVVGTVMAALVFEISHMVSRLRDENVVLAQRLAILEFEVRHSERRAAE